MSIAKAFVQSWQCRIHHQLFDRWGDRRLGIDASGLHRPAELSLAGENAAHAVEYFGTPALVFNRAIDSLGIDLRRFTFVDFGCGKGRVLLLAAQRPFLRVEGIELSQYLQRVAAGHLSRARTRAPAVAHHADATAYVPPDTPLILYFFNPFGATVLARVLDNVEKSLKSMPREAYVLYVNPEHAISFDRRPFWQPMPRPWQRRLVDCVISPWPIAAYRAITPV